MRKTVEPAEIDKMAARFAKAIHDQYLRDVARENCRWAIDFRPGILPLLVHDLVGEAPRSQRDELTRKTLEAFDALMVG